MKKRDLLIEEECRLLVRSIRGACLYGLAFERALTKATDQDRAAVGRVLQLAATERESVLTAKAAEAAVPLEVGLG